MPRDKNKTDLDLLSFMKLLTIKFPTIFKKEDLISINDYIILNTTILILNKIYLVSMIGQDIQNTIRRIFRQIV